MKIIKKLKSYLCIILNKHKFKKWENQHGYGYICKRCGTEFSYNFHELKKLLKKHVIVESAEEIDKYGRTLYKCKCGKILLKKQINKHLKKSERKIDRQKKEEGR